MFAGKKGETVQMSEKIWMAGSAQRSNSINLTMISAMVVLSCSLLGATHFEKAHQAQVASALAAQAALKAAPALAPLPIAVEIGDTHMDLAKKLAKKDAFMALALSVESVPSTAYVDAAGANAGAGYCIEARRRGLGLEKVKSDLKLAGFAEAEISDLTSRISQKIQAVQVTKEQALRLLSITKPQYQSMARSALGAKAFDALPSHKQDVLSYLAYNTGGPKKFVKLLSAVKNNDDIAALSQLAPSVRTKSGAVKKNNRLRAWAQAAWVGHDELIHALAAPVVFEKKYASGSGQEKFIHAHMAFIAGKLSRNRILSQGAKISEQEQHEEKARKGMKR